jgi:calcineurin-like phosphoesterase
MCGPTESVLGREIDPIVQRFLSSMPVNFPVARGPVALCGAIIEIDESTGRALSIQRVSELYVPPEKPAPPPAATEAAG